MFLKHLLQEVQLAAINSTEDLSKDSTRQLVASISKLPPSIHDVVLSSCAMNSVSFQSFLKACPKPASLS